MGKPAEKLNNKSDGLAKYIDINFLNEENAKFKKTEGGILTLKLKNKEYDRIFLHRTFPFSYEEKYISVRDKDGNEIGMVKELTDFSDEVQTIVKEELKWTYFCPEIEKIYSIDEEFGYSYWKVKTDHGQKEFTLRGRNKAITPITETRLIITDIDGNRFQVKNVNKLDKKSFRLVDSLML